MSKEQDTEVLEQEPATENAEQQLDEFFDKLNAKPTEEATAVDAEQEPEEEQADEAEQPESDAVTIEGPTVAMKTLASQYNIKDKVIALARNDEELRVLIEEVVEARRAAEPQPEPTVEPEFVLELPEDEFPADDPARKAFEGLAKELQQTKSDLKIVVNALLEQQNFVEKTQQAEHTSVLGMFDAELDQYESEVLGNRKNETHNNDLRAAIWDKYWKLKEEKPTTADAKLIAEAAKAFGQVSKTQKREQGIRQDSVRRLGGDGGSKPIPASPPTADQRMQALFDRLDAAKK